MSVTLDELSAVGTADFVARDFNPCSKVLLPGIHLSFENQVVQLNN